MKSAPAFQFYAERFLAGTGRMTTSEVGGYIRLLCDQWLHGSIPGDDMRALAQVMGCTQKSAKQIWEQVGLKFQRGLDGQWRNARLEEVRNEATTYRKAQSAKAKRGAEARWGKDASRHAPGIESVCPGDASPTSELLPPESDESKNDSSEPKPHPVKDFLSLHERLFVELYGDRPQKYTGRDAKHAKDAIDDHGYARAAELLQQFFRSRDRFIAGSGHGLGMFATVQNRLIAELTGRAAMHDGLDGLREFARGETLGPS